MDPIDLEKIENKSSLESGPIGQKAKIVQLIISCGVVFAVMIIGSLLMTALISGIYGLKGAELLSDTTTFLAKFGDNLNGYRLIQMLSTAVTFGVPAIIISYLITGKLFGYFDVNKKVFSKAIWYVPALMFLVLPLITLIHFYIESLNLPEAWAAMEDNMMLLMDALLNDPSWFILILNFIMIAILPAVFEELFFRGAMQKLCGQTFKNPHIAILVVGLAFGLIHGQVAKFLPITVLGILLGYLYYWTKNIWFPILGHLFNNGLQVILYFLVARGYIDMDLNNAEMVSPMQTTLFTMIFVAFLYLFYNVTQKSIHEPS